MRQAQKKAVEDEKYLLGPRQNLNKFRHNSITQRLQTRVQMQRMTVANNQSQYNMNRQHTAQHTEQRKQGGRVESERTGVTTILDENVDDFLDFSSVGSEIHRFPDQGFASFTIAAQQAAAGQKQNTLLLLPAMLLLC